MAGVLYEMLCELSAGKAVKGSIELPDRLVLWKLAYDGKALSFKIEGLVSLDEQIELIQPDWDSILH